jgi:eukaryotic-like serine/threonine-protein kinase
VGSRQDADRGHSMRVPIGSRLGRYEVLSVIGAGGMGEVYRAHDVKLERDVALKVLPEALELDAELRTRFGREARLLAALNHPNIAAIYSVEDTGGIHALVMELVEGPTLADRIEHGPFPSDHALRIARQIAEALEYAHDHGIIHRDLKPENVKLTADDSVKLLDFGVAKALEIGRPPAVPAVLTRLDDPARRTERLAAPGTTVVDVETSPSPELATRHGILLGTAAYMSPEQARGEPADRRADIWAFGCVLYEMLTGQRPFRGAGTADTLAAVINDKPDWSLLPRAIHPGIRRLLARCLEKDAKQRLQAIGEARIAIDDVIAGEGDNKTEAAGWVGRRLHWQPALVGVVAIVTLGAIALAALFFRERPGSTEVVRYEIPPPPNAAFRGWLGGFAGNFTVSPDGRKLAFTATDSDGRSHLWVRSFDRLDSRVLDGTDGAVGWPIWSADSRSIAFGARGKLSRIDAEGGPPQAICDAPLIIGGGWSPDDKIVFGSLDNGISQVGAEGGLPVSITSHDPAYPGTPQGFISFLPDGRHFVYGHEADPQGRGGIYIAAVDTSPDEQALKKLLPDVSRVVYAPSAKDAYSGHLLFVRTLTPDYAVGTLMAQPFDAKRMALVGNAVPIAEQVLKTGFSASSTGILAYVSGEGVIASMRGVVQGRLAWHDRNGNVLETVGEPGLYRTLALSPDGGRVAYERAEPQTQNWDLWIYDFARGASSRFTFDPVWDSNPVWSPDGRRIVFASNRGGFFNVYSKASNLSTEETLVFKAGESTIPSSWSSDGRSLLYYNDLPPRNVWSLTFGDGETATAPVLSSRFNEVAARFSPDGHWIAYQSNESGRDEIYVQAIGPISAATSNSAEAPSAGKSMVSKSGGTTPIWRRDGRELFYLSPEGEAMAVAMETDGVLRAGVPRALFKVPRGLLFWDISPDGERFLFPTPEGESKQMLIQVVVNWQAASKN